MTLQRARELLKVQCGFGGGYNRQAVRLILAEVRKLHGAEAVNGLIDEFELGEQFGISGEEL